MKYLVVKCVKVNIKWNIRDIMRYILYVQIYDQISYDNIWWIVNCEKYNRKVKYDIKLKYESKMWYIAIERLSALKAQVTVNYICARELPWTFVLPRIFNV